MVGGFRLRIPLYGRTLRTSDLHRRQGNSSRLAWWPDRRSTFWILANRKSHVPAAESQSLSLAPHRCQLLASLFPGQHLGNSTWRSEVGSSRRAERKSFGIHTFAERALRPHGDRASVMENTSIS